MQPQASGGTLNPPPTSPTGSQSNEGWDPATPPYMQPTPSASSVCEDTATLRGKDLEWNLRVERDVSHLLYHLLKVIQLVAKNELGNLSTNPDKPHKALLCIYHLADVPDFKDGRGQAH